MNFRVSYGIAFALLGLLTIGIGLVFWFVSFRPQTRLEALPEPKAELISAIGDVRVARDGEERPVENGFTLREGDIVRTGEASAASIGFYWSARAELDASSEVRITTATVDAADPRKQDVRLTLVAGRVWSRVLKLLDQESRYGVEYNNVVATVRGTAWAMSARGPLAVVDAFDGVVGLTDGALSADVPAGFTATMDTRGGVPPKLVPTPDETVNDNWIQRQLDADADFGRNVIEARTFLGAAAVDESRALQTEADSGVLRDPGEGHSGYLRVDIVSPDQRTTLDAGKPLALKASAVFVTPNGEVRRDITAQATWQISRPDLATVDGGVVTLVPDGQTAGVEVTTEATLLINGKPVSTTSGSGSLAGSGQEVLVVARWHDGTHSHSGWIRLTAPE